MSRADGPYGRRRLLWQGAWAAAWAWGLNPRAWAQSDWRRQAVPSISPALFVQMHDVWVAGPRARDLLARAQAWRADMAGGLAVQRQHWRELVVAWNLSATVAVGPLVQRRSARRIDFHPVRPDLILQALGAAAQGTLDPERIGSAARGLGALEWLLAEPARWQGPGAAALAGLLLDDLVAEAQALADAWALRQAQVPDESEVIARLDELLNQWLGGLELLRVQAIERPLHEAATRRQRPQFPRSLGCASALDRASRWAALRGLLVFDGAVAPPPGSAPIPFETLLRGRGLNPLADRLRAAARQVDTGLKAVERQAPPASLKALARSLNTLRRLVEAELAASLDIRIGFSDADGD